MSGLEDLPRLVTAVGGLGTAAFGLVDATKVFEGGVNHIGFRGIRAAVSDLIPAAEAGSALSQRQILAMLEANWMGGTDLANQKAIAKSLIKLNLHTSNAALLAKATGVDPGVLTIIGTSLASGVALGVAESNVLSRFDLVVTAILDEAYERSSQQYHNWTRAIAALLAVAMAVAGGRMLGMNPVESLLIGLVATPLAPVAKDLATGLTMAVRG